MLKKYKDYDELDRLFFDDVLEVMKKKYGGKPLKLMETSTFFKRYEKDPVYVQHHPPVYWADYIIAQYENRMRTKTKKQQQDKSWKVFNRTLTVRNVPYSILDAEDEKLISAGTSLKLELLKELMLQEEIPSEVDFREVANLKFSNG